MERALDALEKWLNKKEPHATAALELYHRDCLTNGEPPADMRERIDRILVLVLQSARKDYPYKVLFNRAHLASTHRASTSHSLSDDDLAQTPRLAQQVALAAAERVLRSTRRVLSPGEERTSLASRIKTEMRWAMRKVCDQFEIPLTWRRQDNAAAEDAEVLPTLGQLQESTADAYDGPEVARGEDVASATGRVEGLIGDDRTRADRNIDWQQDEDIDSRKSNGSGRSDPLRDSGMLADGHGFGRVGRYVEPWTQAETAAYLAKQKITPEERERLERERRDRAEAVQRTIAWTLGLKRSMGNFTVDDYDRRRLVGLALLKMQLVQQDIADEAAAAARDPFDAAVSLVAQGKMVEGAAIVSQTQRDETTELRDRALVVLEGGRPPSAAERQRKSRAGRAAELIERSAVNTSQRVFGPENDVDFIEERPPGRTETTVTHLHQAPEKTA